jgi:hypothetical protein
MPSGKHRYAGFFQFPRKEWTELAVVEELIVSLEREGLESLHDPTPFSPDPPDVICLDSNDRRVAVEVVEAVSQEAIAENARGNKVVKWWEPQEFAFHVAGLVRAKDAKVFAGGPFERVVVCVHTDELVVTPEEHGLAISSMPPLRLTHVTAAYILFSYAPGSQSYPVRRIPVAT